MHAYVLWETHVSQEASLERWMDEYRLIEFSPKFSLFGVHGLLARRPSHSALVRTLDTIRMD